MDEEKAIKILTENLAKDLGISIVRDTRWKDKLTEKSMHFYQHSDPFVAGHCYGSRIKTTINDGKQTQENGWNFVNSQHTQSDYLFYYSLDKAIAAEEKYKSANYFFIDQPVTGTASQSSTGFYFFVTPYSIIGKKEVNHLRKHFYKDVDQNIASAMRTLDIQDYSELYKLYSQGGMDKEFMEKYELYLKFVNSQSCLVHNKKGHTERCRIENHFQHSIGELNNIISRILSKTSNIPCDDWISMGRFKFKKYEFEKYTSIGKYKDVLPDFLSFVFSMPYEDQNINVNKEILKLYAENIDYPEIMADEYAKGRHFQDYFMCLNNAQQQNFVRSMKNASERNLANDSFLWSQGFKEVNLDYMNMYKKDSQKFIEYFKSKEQEDKKIILKDIMNCDYTNKDAADWLNKNELDLVREVSMDG